MAKLFFESLDQPQSWLAYIASFVCFLIWLLSLVQWGKWLSACTRIKGATSLENFWISLGFGSLLFSYFGAIAPLFGVLAVTFLLFTLGVGFFLGRYSLMAQSVTSRPLSSLNWILFIGLFLSVFLRLIEGFSLRGHGDALICYLTANRSVSNSGNFSSFLENPSFFLSSSWEQLYFYPNYLLGKAPDLGLATGQRFGQWITAGLAYGGIILGAIILAKNILKKINFSEVEKQTIAMLSALIISAIPSIHWMQNVAKNDLGIIFWSLFGFYLMNRAFQEKKMLPLFLGAVAIGAAIIGKMSSATILFCLLPVFLFYVHGLSRIVQMSGVMVAGGVVGALPILIRNYALTKNLFFPWFRSFFLSKNIFGPSYDHGFLQPAANGSKFTLNLLLEPFSNQKALWLFLLFIPLFIWKRRKLKKLEVSEKFLFYIFPLAVMLQFLIFEIFLRPVTEIRYLGIGLVFMAMLSPLYFFYILPNRPMMRKSAIWIFSLALLASSNLPLFTLKQMWGEKYKPGTELITTHSAGMAKKWLRVNNVNHEPVAVIGDNESYYMLGMPYHEIQYYPPLDRELYSLKNDQDSIKVLKAQGHRYLIDASRKFPLGLETRVTVDRVISAFTSHPESIVYQDSDATIYDLQKIILN